MPKASPRNFYICSTVRHLLFALLKGAAEPDSNHHILVFVDYQNLDLDAWNMESLPNNISVEAVYRSDFRSKLGRSLSGRFFYFLAMRNRVAPSPLQSTFLTMLAQQCPAFALEFAKPMNRRLWCFNERNKMARLFRAVTGNFSLIEEGAGNYHALQVAPWKRPWRALQGLPAKTWSFGEDKRCEELHVQFPERLPAVVRGKSTRLRLLDRAAASQLMAKLLNMQAPLATLADTVIIATTPIDQLPGIDKVAKCAIYSSIVDSVTESGLRPSLKLHPREDSHDYDTLQARVLATPAKLPIEVFIYCSPTPITVVALFTSAGIGLEDEFRLIQLVNDPADHEGTMKELHQWARNPRSLREKLTKELATVAA